jgi:uncharacterized DUF497 family protein
MLFEWDAGKRLSNLEKHGFDFLRARRISDGRPRLDVESPRGDENRILSIAILDDKFITVAWMQRHEGVVRIISVRRARHGEERQYRQLHG